MVIEIDDEDGNVILLAAGKDNDILVVADGENGDVIVDDNDAIVDETGD
jgi:hypothetical protein